MRKLVLALALFLPSISLAQSVTPQASQKLIFNGSATNHAINAINWTGFYRVDSYHCVSYNVIYTRHLASDVTLQCETADDGATVAGSGYTLEVITATSSGGVSTTKTNVLDHPVTTSEKWAWTICDIPMLYLNCGATGTGADASDTWAFTIKGLN